MIYVKGGSFLMGSNKGYYEEKPIHEVSLDDFWIGKYPITQAQWNTVVTQATVQGLPHNLNPDPAYSKSSQNPVEKVSWIDCMTWIDLLQNLKPVQNENLDLNSDINLRLNLPTEAQWEYAAQGGIHQSPFQYAGSDNLEEVGWYVDNSNNTTHAVGLLKPNELGIYDMSGNLWEWCLDKWNEMIYEYIPPNFKNPLLLDHHITDSNAVTSSIGNYIKTRENNKCVMRGGSWGDIAYDCRLTLRNVATSDNNDNFNGFRLFASI
jgi:formylglycine-generating enzyme required for sulfatase activity